MVHPLGGMSACGTLKCACGSDCERMSVTQLCLPTERVHKLLARGPFLEPPDNSPGPKTILGTQYSKIAIYFLWILKA